MVEYIKMALAYGPEALEAALAVLGGLKVFARYTKTEWDDKAIAALEKPIRMALSFLPKKEEKKDGK